MLKLRADRKAGAAMEFAFIAPVLVIVILGVYEICNAAIIYEQVQNAAHSIPASASNLAAEAGGTLGPQVYTGQTALTYNQIQLVASEIWAEIPELRSGFQNGAASVTITSVSFIPTIPPTAPAAQTLKPGTVCNPAKGTTYCSYTPTVIWSVAYTGGNTADGHANFATPALRSCTGAPTAGTQKNATVYYAGTTPAYVLLSGGLNSEAPPSTNTAAATVPTWAASDLTSLPSYFVANPDPILAAPSPILVVDVHLKYTPIFGLFLKNGMNFYGTGFFPVRSVEAATASATVTTPLTLSQQFTSIIDDATDGANGVIPGPPTSTYCINTGHGLNPYAYSVPAT